MAIDGLNWRLTVNGPKKSAIADKNWTLKVNGSKKSAIADKNWGFLKLGLNSQLLIVNY